MANYWKVIFIFFGINFFGCAGIADIENQLTATITKEVATDLITSFMEEEGADWGSPYSISNRYEYYYFFFTTPSDEAKLMGSRVLSVNKEDGVVGYGPRF